MVRGLFPLPPHPRAEALYRTPDFFRFMLARGMFSIPSLTSAQGCPLTNPPSITSCPRRSGEYASAAFSRHRKMRWKKVCVAMVTAEADLALLMFKGGVGGVIFHIGREGPKNPYCRCGGDAMTPGVFDGKFFSCQYLAETHGQDDLPGGQCAAPLFL